VIPSDFSFGYLSAELKSPVKIPIPDEVAELEDDTGTTTSHGDVDLGLGFSGDWRKRFTPNDKWDAGAGGHTTWGIYPDAVNCADLGGNFGLFYDSYDYGDGGPGTDFVTIGWTWSF
jgi:hypothetical protein